MLAPSTDVRSMVRWVCRQLRSVSVVGLQMNGRIGRGGEG
jgi:hypothetical protein